MLCLDSIVGLALMVKGGGKPCLKVLDHESSPISSQVAALGRRPKQQGEAGSGPGGMGVGELPLPPTSGGTG